MLVGPGVGSLLFYFCELSGLSIHMLCIQAIGFIPCDHMAFQAPSQELLLSIAGHCGGGDGGGTAKSRQN